MKLLSIAYPFAPVGPRAVGGAEQILTDLDHALSASGHTSFVIACEGSRAQGTLFPGPAIPNIELNETIQRAIRHDVQAIIDHVLQLHAVNAVHMHGLDFWQYAIPPQIAVLATLHLPIAWYPHDLELRIGPNAHLQCVSDTQRATLPASFRDLPVIPNGVEIPPFQNTRKEDFAIAMGRICPEKNTHAALEAGTRAHTRVLLGGQVFPYAAHQQYFREKVQPLLGTHEFLGPLLPERKRKLLSRAKCLLHPTVAPETSSLVAMEAMAAGTPVIAFRSGALTEIVDHGVTGFLVSSVEEMADAIRRVDQISPRICWQEANRRFSKRRMTQQYLQFYKHLIQAYQAEHRCA